MSFDYVNIKFWSWEIVLAFEKYLLCNRLDCRGAREPCFCIESKLWFSIVLVKQARSFLKNTFDIFMWLASVALIPAYVAEK